MLFNAVLFSSSLLISAVLAIPSGLSSGVARRREGHQSQINNRLEQAVGGASNAQYSKNWAGAISAQDYGTFTSVVGTFTVPTPSGESGSSAAAWVGIDGDSCNSVILQTGVDFTVSPNGPTYNAWSEWFPAPSINFQGISISAGDIIQLNVTALSQTTGTATIENLTNGQSVSQYLESPVPLCGQSAEWIVEDYMQGNSQVTFADFHEVTFTNAEATGAGTYNPSGAIVVDIKQNDQVLTSTSINGSSVTIEYV